MSIDARLQATMAETALDELRRRAESLAQETVEEHQDESVALLLFVLGEEWYAVQVSDVREIYHEYRVTRIPCVPDHVLGVVNIRGEIVSVTDLARLMRLAPGANTGAGTAEELPAIVLRNGECVTAAVVDEIGDIIEVPQDALEPPVSMTGKSQSEFVGGSVYVDGRLVGLLNLERVLQPVGVTE